LRGEGVKLKEIKAKGRLERDVKGRKENERRRETGMTQGSMSVKDA